MLQTMSVRMVRTLAFTKDNGLPFCIRQFSVRVIGRRGPPPPHPHDPRHGSSLGIATVMSLLRGFKNYICGPVADEDDYRVRELIASDLPDSREELQRRCFWYSGWILTLSRWTRRGPGRFWRT